MPVRRRSAACARGRNGARHRKGRAARDRGGRYGGCGRARAGEGDDRGAARGRSRNAAALPFPQHAQHRPRQCLRRRRDGCGSAGCQRGRDRRLPLRAVRNRQYRHRRPYIYAAPFGLRDGLRSRQAQRHGAMARRATESVGIARHGEPNRSVPAARPAIKRGYPKERIIRHFARSQFEKSGSVVSRKILSVRSAFCAGAAFFVLTGAAMADEATQIETVTVTARKMAENLQDVPGSLTVLTADDLRSTGTDTTADLFGRVPNVSMSGGIGGALQGQFGIRGISTLVRNIGVESGLGIYVDGVYQGRPDNYNQELIDVAQVEVLRGPQGTIFGKNTIAGALNITTVKPEDDQVNTVDTAEFGNYGLKRFAGYLTGPLVDGALGAKLSLCYVTRDGYTENLH